MDPHYTEWLNLLVRWLHIIVGIAWIGASFYFNWLENNLNRKDPQDGLSGDLWAIHGGGIYHLQKYKLAPRQMPENLHWFKWEAYATWLSGMTLLFVVYYLNAQLYLLAPGSGLSPMQGIGISILSLVAGWLVYHSLCESALGKRPALLGLVLLLLLVAAAWGLSQVFNGRAAYIHIGAIIGTMMVGNVAYVIIPGQRELVNAIKANRTPDPLNPGRAMLRSRHNNYLTLPVLFIMISNHFPSTYGSEWNWAILLGIAVLSVLVRHYFNTRHAHPNYAWTLPAAALGMIALAFVTNPNRGSEKTDTQPAKITLSEVYQVVQQRCTSCHAANPTSELFSSPPAGVILESEQDVVTQANRIHAQTVATQVMPLGNLTGMLPEERVLIGVWFKQRE